MAEEGLCSRRSGRLVRAPKHLVHYVPGLDARKMTHIPTTNPIPSSQTPATLPAPSQSPPPPRPVPVPVTTAPDELGIYRIYPNKPSFIPEHGASLDRICDTPTLRQPPASLTPSASCSGPSSELPSDLNNPFAPFPNIGIALMMYWRYSGPRVKSGDELVRLTDTMQIFSLDRCQDFNFDGGPSRLGKYLKGRANPLRCDSGWINSSVTLRLPCAKAKWASEQASENPRYYSFHVREQSRRSYSPHDTVRAVSSAWKCPLVPPNVSTAKFLPLRQCLKPTQIFHLFLVFPVARIRWSTLWRLFFWDRTPPISHGSVTRHYHGLST